MGIRNIEFRGKTDKGKWVQGVPFFEEDRCYIIEDLFICDEYDCTGAVNTMVIPETVGQYTGLTDKNGKKIFEGDIIIYGFKPCVVKWDKYNASFSLYVFGTTKVAGFNQETMNLKKVAGNMYDSPELLEGVIQ